MDQLSRQVRIAANLRINIETYSRVLLRLSQLSSMFVRVQDLWHRNGEEAALLLRTMTKVAFDFCNLRFYLLSSHLHIQHISQKQNVAAFCHARP